MAGFLADLVVLVHFGYLLFTVGGEIIILIGGLLSWKWVRNLTFRIIHLLAIVIVSLEAIIGAWCPITILEYRLRRSAGQVVEKEISFVGRIVRSLLFYEFPPWVFTMLYIGFGVLVILTMIFIPPRKRK
jgi:hypothetical protein